MKVLRTSAAAAAVSLVGLAVATAPAGASTKAPVLKTANTQASGFAGYAIGGTGGTAVTGAAAHFTLPSITCAATGNTGVVPVTQIFSSTGTTYAAGGVFVVCESGHLYLQNYLSINGQSPTVMVFAPAAKDKMSVSVSQSATGAKVTLTDFTQKKTQTYTGVKGSSSGTDDNANIGDGAVTIGGTAVGNPTFGAIPFSMAKTNGSAIGLLPYTAYDEATAATGGTLQVSTSKLNKAGTWFKTTFDHA